MLIPPLLLVAMVILAGTIHLTGRIGAVLLAGTGVWWLLDNQDFEGKILWVVAPTHGLTAGDLVGLVAIVIAIWRFVEFSLARRR